MDYTNHTNDIVFSFLLVSTRQRVAKMRLWRSGVDGIDTIHVKFLLGKKEGAQAALHCFFHKIRAIGFWFMRR